jgi:integrase/recombinase XerD
MNAITRLSMSGSASDADRLALIVYLDHLAPSGRRSMRSLLQRVGACFGWQGDCAEWPWLSLSYAALMHLRATLSTSDLSVNTVNTMLAAVRGVLKAGFQLGAYSADEWQRIQAVPNVRGRRVTKGRQLTPREVERLLAACRADDNPLRALRDEAILMVLLYAGLRRTELVRLNMDDFNPRSGLLQIQFGKGNKQRALSLPNPAKQKLKAWLKQRGAMSMSGPLFVRCDEPPSKQRQKQNCKKPMSATPCALNAHQVYALLRRRCRQAQVALCSPHDLRRTFVSRLLELGVDLNTTRQLAGHEHVQTTTLYDRRSDKNQRQAMANFRF